MSKYAPLRSFLTPARAERSPMTFAEIERVSGSVAEVQGFARLVEQQSDNNVMTNEWLAAGFKTEQVDVRRARVVFRRAKS